MRFFLLSFLVVAVSAAFEQCSCYSDTVEGFWANDGSSKCAKCQTNYAIDDGCKTKNVCDDAAYCNNHGVCTRAPDGTQSCSCNARYGGDTCNQCADALKTDYPVCNQDKCEQADCSNGQCSTANQPKVCGDRGCGPQETCYSSRYTPDPLVPGSFETLFRCLDNQPAVAGVGARIEIGCGSRGGSIRTCDGDQEQTCADSKNSVCCNKGTEYCPSLVNGDIVGTCCMPYETCCDGECCASNEACVALPEPKNGWVRANGLPLDTSEEDGHSYCDVSQVMTPATSIRVVLVPLFLGIAFLVIFALTLKGGCGSDKGIVISAILVMFPCFFILFNPLWSYAVLIFASAAISCHIIQQDASALLGKLVLAQTLVYLSMLGGLGVVNFFVSNNTNLFPSVASGSVIAGSNLYSRYTGRARCAGYYNFFIGPATNSVNKGGNIFSKRPWDQDPDSGNYYGFCSYEFLAFIDAMIALASFAYLFMVFFTARKYANAGGKA